MEQVQYLLDNVDFPLITAFLLGLLVALHPCPMAANIAAMGYMARDINNGARIFRNGMFYVLGRILSYSLLGAVLIAVIRGGEDIFHISSGFGEWGERILVVILLSVGLWMLLNPLFHRHEHVPSLSAMSGKQHGASGSFWLGIFLTLAFCPESAIVFFGMLMPMSAKSDIGYVLPVVFAIGTSLPVILLSWGFAYGMSGVPSLRARMHTVQKWMNAIVGVIFVAAGIFCMLF